LPDGVGCCCVPVGGVLSPANQELLWGAEAAWEVGAGDVGAGDVGATDGGVRGSDSGSEPYLCGASGTLARPAWVVGFAGWSRGAAGGSAGCDRGAAGGSAGSPETLPAVSGPAVAAGTSDWSS
jgi:hypothetical protein